MSDSSDQQSGFGGLIGAAAEGGFDWQDDDEPAEESAETVAVLQFVVGETSFAVACEYVREITAEWTVTPVPGAPKHIRGVGVLRRRVIGVLDLIQWLDPVAEVEPGEDDGRIVIVEAGDYTVGVWADEVIGMDEWPEQVFDKSRVPDSINTRTRRYAAGIRLSDDEATVLLDVPKLLDDAAAQ